MGDWFHWTPMEVLQGTLAIGLVMIWGALRDVERRLFQMHQVLDRIADNTGRVVPPHLRDQF